MSKVLLIDDEEIAYLFINRYIELLDTSCVTLEWANTPEKGLEYTQNCAWDLILIDLLFGLEFKGPALIADIKNIVSEQKTEQKTQIVAITQLSLTNAQKQECINAGAKEIVTKWPSKMEMQTLLKGWLNLDEPHPSQPFLLGSIRLQLKLFRLQYQPLHV
ncbi:response regulator [Candidatus Poribacteria bacterium]|nr:response regulator [Candidatus Poribacteria bacterium]